MQNRQKAEGMTSKYKGVSYTKNAKTWRAQYGREWNSQFATEEEAAKQYDKYVLLRFGKNARTNGLVTWNEVKDLNLETEFKKKEKNKEAPEGITHNKRTNKYVVDICYNKIRYRSKVYEKLEDAINDLENYKRGIDLAKQIEEKMHLEKEISRNNDNMAVLYATSGNDKIEVIVDDDLWHTLSKMKWTVTETGYASTHLNDKTITMHSYVFKDILKRELKDGRIIDHINSNKLDNRSSNLRANTRGGNSHNKKKKAGAASQYFGVSKNWINWRAQISYQGTTYRLGTYKTELEAAQAYNKKAIELYGEHANLNVFE